MSARHSAVYLSGMLQTRLFEFERNWLSPVMVVCGYRRYSARKSRVGSLAYRLLSRPIRE
jgi:hypothetical protein